MTAKDTEKRLTFWEHLAELRTRLFRSAIALVVGVVVAWTFREWFLSFLTRPLQKAYRASGMEVPVLHFAGPADAFTAYLQMALVGGVFLVSPVLLWELWGFVSPGLYRKEKRFAIPFVLFTSFFFVGGAWFGYQIVLPIGFEFLLGFAGDIGGIRVEDVLMIGDVLKMTTKLLLAFGLVFELPLVLTLLAALGIVDHKQLWRFTRWAVLIIVVAASFLTPPDVMSQVLMSGPILGLYFLSIGLAWLVGRRRKKKEARERNA